MTDPDLIHRLEIPAMTKNGSQPASETSLLIVDDDKPFLERVARAMETRGYMVETADLVSEGIKKVESAPPAFAVVDLRMNDGNGLDVIEQARRDPAGFAHGRADRLRQHRHRGDGGENGAIDYLAKPADADDIDAALRREPARCHHRRTSRCRPIAYAGNTSSASTNSATATSRRPRAGSTCTGARCSGSSPSGRRAEPAPRRRMC